MLGARARAAEYNAAKAASARQQANQEAGEQKIPKPPPTPLSAFTRNASASRNKGIKTFKPLVLTEEEDSAGSVEQENEEPDSPSPESREPPRSASLPPPQTVTNVRPEIVPNVQTPHRFHEGPYIPFAPRAMLTDDGYFITQHLAMSYMQQYMHYQPHYSTVHTPQVLSAPNIGCFSSPQQYEGPYSYPDIGLPPTTPVPEPRPQLQRERESGDSAAAETEPAKTQSSHTSPSVSRPGLSLGGVTTYVFGPDDLSPAKCEVKQQAREQAFKAQTEAIKKAKLEESVKDAKSAEPARRPRGEEALLRSFQGVSLPNTQKELLGKMDSSGEQNFPDLAEQQTKTQLEHRPGVERTSSETLVPTEANWPYLGHGGAYYGGNSEARGAENKESIALRTDNASERIKHILLERLNQRAEADAAAAAIKPPPGLPRPKPQKPRLLDSRAEQITNLKFPLVDLESPEWLDVRPLTEQKRNHMRRIYKTVKTSSISDKYRDTWEDRGGLPRPEFDQHLEQSKQDFLARRKQIEELADEMQKKWEYGGSFGSAAMETKQARQQAGTVKAVGGIISALSTQLEDKTGCHHRGSRPYTVAPDYAIRRGVGLDKRGKSTSLFDLDEDADRVVPLRLARDPRFRPQLGDAIRLDEARIPRMFVSKRV